MKGQHDYNFLYKYDVLYFVIFVISALKDKVAALKVKQCQLLQLQQQQLNELLNN